MLERLSWKKLLLELALCAIPALLLGALLGQPLILLCLALFGLLLWHFRNLLRLSWWLWMDKSMTPPAGSGSWEPLFYGLHQLQMRNKKRRGELAQLIKRFRSGAESLPDAVVLITDEGAIFWCNRLAQHLLGLRWPDDNGQNILNLIRQPEFSQYLHAMQFTRPLEMALSNGRHLEFRLMPYSDQQWLLVARDVTHMYQLEQARSHFFANVSHELRTPLTVLQGYLELMDDQTLSETMRQKTLHTMSEQTQRMAGLVRQLLTLSRIEASASLPDNIVDVPRILYSLAQETQALCSSQAEQSQIEEFPCNSTKTDIQPSATPLTDHNNTSRKNNKSSDKNSDKKHQWCWQVDKTLQVRGDEDQLHSALSNLIHNALRHTPPGSLITVSWRRVTQGALFSVNDNGDGIAPEHLPHLTERFYRVDKARSRKTGGSGLGLAIVKHALSHHDSRLDIHSIPGEGACFSFVLPEYLLVTKE